MKTTYKNYEIQVNDNGRAYIMVDGDIKGATFTDLDANGQPLNNQLDKAKKRIDSGFINNLQKLA